MTQSRDRRADDRTKTITLTAVLTVIAMMLSYVEMLIPLPLGIPGIKLGLASVVTIYALYALGTGYAVSIDVMRIVLTGLLFGTPFAMLYSLAGGVLSLTVMIALRSTGLFSVTGVSMGGGAAHNTGQLIVAALVLSGTNIWVLFPALLIAGTVTGIITGMISQLVLLRTAAPGTDA